MLERSQKELDNSLISCHILCKHEYVNLVLLANITCKYQHSFVRDKPVCHGIFDGLAADLDTVLLSSGVEQKVVFETNINPKFVRAAWLIKARKLTFTDIECELLHVIIVSHYTVLAAQFVYKLHEYSTSKIARKRRCSCT
ncbi:hypothetical protein Bca4012_020575 [Brassica carinata]